MDNISLPRVVQAMAAGLVRALLFHRITIVNRHLLPSQGPVLYLGLHRNGAIDLFLYRPVAPEALPLVSKQLTRKWPGRVLFHGIEVVRKKDVARYGMSTAQNQSAIDACVSHLKQDGRLLILPEGTSDLGPKHLPFHSGAARILLASFAAGKEVSVVPLGIHYEQGWVFRSNAEIVIGVPFGHAVLDTVPERDHLDTLMQQITQSLEEVGINVADRPMQKRLEQTAYIACLNPRISYFRALKAFESGLPPQVQVAWQTLDTYVNKHGAAMHLTVPVAPVGSTPACIGLWVLTAPVVAMAVAVNAPPLLAGYMAGHRLADAPNVITLWRSLVGVPVAIIYWTAMLILSIKTGAYLWLAFYAVITTSGLLLFRKTSQMTAMLKNALFHFGLKQPFRRLYVTIQEYLAGV